MSTGHGLAAMPAGWLDRPARAMNAAAELSVPTMITVAAFLSLREPASTTEYREWLRRTLDHRYRLADIGAEPGIEPLWIQRAAQIERAILNMMATAVNVLLCETIAENLMFYMNNGRPLVDNLPLDPATRPPVGTTRSGRPLYQPPTKPFYAAGIVPPLRGEYDVWMRANIAWWSGATHALVERATADPTYFYRPIFDEFSRATDRTRFYWIPYATESEQGPHYTDDDIKEMAHRLSPDEFLFTGHHGSLKLVMQMLSLRQYSAANRWLNGDSAPLTGKQLVKLALADIDVLRQPATGLRPQTGFILRDGNYHDLPLEPRERFVEAPDPDPRVGLRGPSYWVGTKQHASDYAHARYAGWKLPEIIGDDGRITCRVAHPSFVQGPWRTPKQCAAQEIAPMDVLLNNVIDLKWIPELCALLADEIGITLTSLNAKQFSSLSVHFVLGTFLAGSTFFQRVIDGDGHRLPTPTLGHTSGRARSHRRR